MFSKNGSEPNAQVLRNWILNESLDRVIYGSIIFLNYEAMINKNKNCRRISVYYFVVIVQYMNSNAIFIIIF